MSLSLVQYPVSAAAQIPAGATLLAARWCSDQAKVVALVDSAALPVTRRLEAYKIGDILPAEIATATYIGVAVDGPWHYYVFDFGVVP